jgi:hypothetical protein
MNNGNMKKQPYHWWETGLFFVMTRVQDSNAASFWKLSQGKDSCIELLV